MSKNSIDQRPDFKGETVILLAKDEAGLDDIRAAILRAIYGGAGTSHSLQPDAAHELFVEQGRADIALQARTTIWHMSPAKLIEILEKLDAMKLGGPSHHYVDIMSPVQTLVLSREEYV